MEKQQKEIDTWQSLRVHLNNNYSFSKKWEEAINLFNDRIQNKYFSPIEALLFNDLRKGEGFAIVTIQCALIETFAAFKEGLIYNHSKALENSDTYEYYDSGNLFIRFLNTDPIFNGIFYSVNKKKEIQFNVPFSAPQFYAQVRCGLMHEARTKGKWIINATKNDNLADKKFIKSGIKGNIIYRTLFQKALKNYFENYNR